MLWQKLSLLDYDTACYLTLTIRSSLILTDTFSHHHYSLIFSERNKYTKKKTYKKTQLIIKRIKIPIEVKTNHQLVVISGIIQQRVHKA